ncbi:MAG: HNH endonuclease [Gemmatimonadales bacterium]|nr:HNH endonuclease [Gemmatimonadales bacterium]
MADLETHTWHAGKSTILGENLNRKTQTQPFVDKRDGYYKVSEIKMTLELVPFEKWGPAQIKKRAGDLAKRILAKWRQVKPNVLL